MYNWIVKRHETAAAIYDAACTTPEQVEAVAAKYGDEVFWMGATHGSIKGTGDIDTTVADILLKIGIPARVLGHQYVREAIKLTVRDRSLAHSMTNALYPAMAKKFNTTVSSVERAIRYAIELAWNRGDLETLQKYFGYTVSSAKGKPTNGEFIAALADHIVSLP